MKMNYFNTFLKKVGIVALTLSTFTAVAQEEETETKKFDISGSVDAYFRTNLTTKNAIHSPTEDFLGYPAPTTSFVDKTGFSVGMINVIASYAGEKAGFVADLAYGPRGANAIDGEGSENIVNQAYVYLNASDAVTFTLGRFNTYLGYEVISPVGNFNYSTSYMFSNGPFSHNGLKADFTIDDNWSAMVAVMNPTDVTFGNPADTYVVGAQVGYANDSGSAYLNFRFGNEDIPSITGPTFQVDLTTGWDLSEEFYLGVNTTYASTEPQGDGDASTFYGFALYPQYSISDSFALGLRGEYFGETNFAAGAVGLDENGDGSVVATTLTAQYKVGGLTIIPELRLDSLSEEAFPDADLEPSKSLASFVVGAVYAF